MPYIDPTGVKSGWSDVAQPELGYTEWVEEAPFYPDPWGLPVPEDDGEPA
jgi:hypothetical protein